MSPEPRPGLVPLPFSLLLRRMVREAREFGSVYDLPASRWYLPDARHDLAVEAFGERGATPLGPAAGPHTQLAQNIAAAWLAGGRFFELKTVQQDDRIRVPRPCIRVREAGFNVEWSQELALPDSLREYAKAAYLLEVLKATRAFGWIRPGAPLDTVLHASVGYTLAGLLSEPMQAFLQGLAAPAPLFEALRQEVPPELGDLRDLPLPAALCKTVTLSTFHGCRPGEIESMARLLMERGFGVVLKLNPTLLGRARVEYVLQRLGFHAVRLVPQTFERDLAYGTALELVGRLRDTAAQHGVPFGVKLTNTLVVRNDPALFPTQREAVMYLSGAPLYAIAAELALRLRADVAMELPVAFSAGLGKENVAEAMAMGAAPLTSCTDLLRPRGYARLKDQAEALDEALTEAGVGGCEGYVLGALGKGPEALAQAFASTSRGVSAWESRAALAAQAPLSRLPELAREAAEEAGLDPAALLARAVRIAGLLNTAAVLPRLLDEPGLHADAPERPPKKRPKRIALHDCLECDQCRTACPNLALFSFASAPLEAATVKVSAAGERPGDGFRLRRDRQTALLQDACNACGSCEVFCPETGAPHESKERFFVSRALFDDRPELDGFHWDGSALLGRVDGEVWTFTPEGGGARFNGPAGELSFELGRAGLLLRGYSLELGAEVDTALAWRFLVLYRGVVRGARPSWVAA